MERPLIPNDIDHLDPGIEHLVLNMRSRGLQTTDSGDGESKLKGGHWDRLGFQPYDKDDVMPFPHVAIQTNAERLGDDVKLARDIITDDWRLDAFFVEEIEQWFILVVNDTVHRHIEHEAYKMSEALRSQMRDMLKRVRDDISNGTAPLNDVWWFDDATKMEDAITEALS